ncbi:MAG: rRNA maturation RNase YbeY [Acidimicrobiia bacterium]
MSRRRRLPDEGTLEVFAADEQSTTPIDPARWALLARQVLDTEGIRGAAELSLLFVDETTIAELNRQFMGAEGPTDVLAFPLEDDVAGVGRWPDSGTTGPATGRGEPGDVPLLLGDIVICPSVAAANAAGRARALDDEMALLTVHGVLHILGMDHADAEEEAAMQAKERSLLERFHRSAP